ncbi:hypothetical protein [Parvularcula sp. LCG005]|uniref:hypothetical protein n=1 Tax=Parvularcula sp. LCG005 TaxID=3078805 RepID=UPI002943B493|nr:hypothetical protein [Parvularcula sp. LCG005]WOI53610.1 hypothetical protein RUI03_01120 [Parvularcula sp. LCG005]
MHVFAAGDTYHYWENIVPILRSIGGELHAGLVSLDDQEHADSPSADDIKLLIKPQTGLDADELEHWLGGSHDAHAMLFYLPADLYVASAMSRAIDPQLAVQSWISAARTILDTRLKRRSHTTLFNAVEAVKARDAWLEAIERIFGVGYQTPQTDGSTIFHPDLIYLALARQHLAANKHVYETEGQLEANRIPVSPSIPDISADRLSEAARKYHSTSSELRVAESRIADLTEELSDTQTALDKARKQISDTQAIADAHMMMAGKIKRAAMAEADLLSQLKESNALCEEYYFKTVDLEATASILEGSAQKLKAEVERQRHIVMEMQNSSSWKASVPLRLLGRLLRKLKTLSPSEYRKILQISRSAVFDGTWYSERYQDVPKGGIRPATHYFRFGAQELRAAGPNFSTREYLKANPDVVESGINPVLHYEKYGRAENRHIYEA